MRESTVPHFLRVVRSIANVRGAALPLAAAFTTVVAGVGCPVENGVLVQGTGGAETTTSTGGAGGAGGGQTTTSVVMGVTAMPDGGDGGLQTGVMVMPDGGLDGGH